MISDALPRISVVGQKGRARKVVQTVLSNPEECWNDLKAAGYASDSKSEALASRAALCLHSPQAFGE